MSSEKVTKKPAATAASHSDPVPKQLDKNTFLVQDAGDDVSLCFLNNDSAEALDLFRGDTVRLTRKGNSNNKKTTIAVAMLDSEKIEKKGVVGLNKQTRKNLHVKLGDLVTLKPELDVKYGESVTILPFEDTLKNFSRDIFDDLLKPHFLDAYRPVQKGDCFECLAPGQLVEFKVLDVVTDQNAGGDECCIVSPDTIVRCDGEPLKRDSAQNQQQEGEGDTQQEEEPGAPSYYDQLGGNRKALSRLRELIELPLTQPLLFRHLGQNATSGVLLSGASGFGKTYMIRAIAHECNTAELVTVNCGTADCQRVRDAFARGIKKMPSIVLFDNVDLLSHEAASELVQVCFDELPSTSVRSLSLVATTTNPKNVDKSLLRAGRFESQVELASSLTEIDRLEILQLVTRNMPLDSDVRLDDLAKQLQGYSPADIVQFCQQAALACATEKASYFSQGEKEKFDAEVLSSVQVNQSHFEESIRKSSSSSSSASSCVRWDDIGGLEAVKSELQQLIQYPIEYPVEFERFGVSPSKSVLLYGPPSSGKQMLARAVANESCANYIQFDGDKDATSADALREVFARASQSAPCVLHLSHFESLTCKFPGSDRPDYSSLLLSLMDELLLEPSCQVFLIGSTHRPDMLNSAFIKPGRMSEVIYVPLPDQTSRVSIFKSSLRKAPVAQDVDLERLASVTHGFNGGDIKAICQAAAKFAIRESRTLVLEHERKLDIDPVYREYYEDKEFDPVREITRKHFEAAMQTARPAVQPSELRRYNLMAEQFQGLKKNEFDEESAAAKKTQQEKKLLEQEEQDDLYS